MQYYIYGKHSVICALLNKKRILHKIIVTNNDNLKYVKTILQQRGDSCNYKIDIESPNKLNSLLGFNTNHQGLVLLTSELNQMSLENIVKNSSDNSCLIILDQPNDPSNVGAILRSCAAFNADALIIPKNNSPNENSSIAKSASGSLEKIPLIRVTNIVNTINFLKKNNYWVIGLDGTVNKSINESPYLGKTAFIFGSEHNGLRLLTKKNCDLLVKIPFNNKNIESLNLSNTVSIVLYRRFSQ